MTSAFARTKLSIKGRLDNLLSWLRSKKIFFDKLLPYYFICYFVVVFSTYLFEGIPYVSSITGSTAFFIASKGLCYSSLIALIFLYSISHCNSSAIRQLVPFIFCSIFSFAGVITAPIFIDIKITTFYGYILETQTSIGFFDQLLSYCETIVELIFAFAVLFVFSQGTSLKKLKPFFVFVVLLGIFECIYSVAFQFDSYLALLKFFSNPQSGFDGYTNNISGTFLSKNGFGFLLFQGAVASSVLLHCFKKKAYLGIYVLFNLIAFVSSCKTSFLAIALIDVGLIINFLLYLKKTRKTIFSVLIAVVLIAVCFVFFVAFFPGFSEGSVLSKIHNLIQNLLVISGSATVSSRFQIWALAANLLRFPNVIFGYGSAASSILAGYFGSSMSFHNFVIELLFEEGIFAIATYGFALFMALKIPYSYARKNHFFVLLIVIILSSFMYGMGEASGFLLDVSGHLFTSSIVVAGFCGSAISKKVILCSKRQVL